jgi:hypothetical protein
MQTDDQAPPSTAPEKPSGAAGGSLRAEDLACKNTDREIWRERDGDYYADSIHVTEGGGIGIDCGGTVYVKPIREWHRLAGGPLTCNPADELCRVLNTFVDTARHHQEHDQYSCAYDTMLLDITVPNAELILKAFSLLKNARNILKNGPHFYTKEIERVLNPRTRD